MNLRPQLYQETEYFTVFDIFQKWVCNVANTRGSPFKERCAICKSQVLLSRSYDYVVVMSSS